MKKIVALGLAAALVGSFAFAGEPAANLSVVSFDGNASVEWGVDLDAGKTGFKNATDLTFKTKLFDAGDKATSGDGVWGEIVIKIDDSDSVGPNGFYNGGWKTNTAYVDSAKVHINDFYVGIKSGDVKTGTVDFTTAVRSGDPWYHPGRWLTEVGPEIGYVKTPAAEASKKWVVDPKDGLKQEDVKATDAETDKYQFSQGIVLGYGNNNIGVEIDFRSLETSTQYSDCYAMAAEVALKSGNEWVEDLEAKVGGSMNLSDIYYTEKDNVGTKVEDCKDCKFYGYSAMAAYKLGIDDKFYVKPMVGLVGTYATAEKYSENANDLVASVLLGWGDTASYGSTGLFYFGDDQARGLTPGFSVLADISLPTVTKNDDFTTTAHDALVALIVPSFYLGDLLADTLPGFKAAAYAEIGIYNGEKDAKTTDKSKETWGCAADKDDTLAMAIAASVAYDIKADDVTATVKAGMRYANAAYANNGTAGICPASDKSVFLNMGSVKDAAKDNYFNLSAGVDVAGLIANTNLYANYVSANLNNSTDYGDATMYNVKNGTFNVGCKIHF